MPTRKAKAPTHSAETETKLELLNRVYNELQKAFNQDYGIYINVICTHKEDYDSIDIPERVIPARNGTPSFKVKDIKNLNLVVQLMGR